MLKYNIRAVPFVPFINFIENATFDRLEQNWIQHNSYIFEDVSTEYLLKNTVNTPYEKCPGHRININTNYKITLEQIKEVAEIRSYASVI